MHKSIGGYLGGYLCQIWLTKASSRHAMAVPIHYCDVIMGAIASQITSLTTVYSTVYSGADQRKHQSCASLVFVRGIHRWLVNSPHKWLVTRKMFHLMTSSCPVSSYSWSAMPVINRGKWGDDWSLFLNSHLKLILNEWKQRHKMLNRNLDICIDTFRVYV